MNVEHRLKLLVRRLLNNAVPGVTGVIDDDVHRSKLFDQPLDNFV